jgi:hypothetical protein
MVFVDQGHIDIKYQLLKLKPNEENSDQTFDVPVIFCNHGCFDGSAEKNIHRNRS